MKTYDDYEFLYRKAAEETKEEMKEANISWQNDEDRFLAGFSAIAIKLCNMGLSEEETFIHIRRNNWGHVTEEKLRQIVGTAYDTHSKDRKTEKSASGRKGRAEILQMIRYLESRYQFRYNTVMKYTEYRPNNSWVGDFRPVDARVQKSMTLDVQIADIHVSIKDVRNFLESDRIRNYSPIESYLFDCLGNGTERTASVPWHEPYPPTILIGKTGFTPGFWEWLTSGAACIAVNMATVPCRCSFPSRVTTRAPSAAVSSLPNYRGALPTI